MSHKVFVLGKPFWPSIMLGTKFREYPNAGASLPLGTGLIFEP